MTTSKPTTSHLQRKPQFPVSKASGLLVYNPTAITELSICDEILQIFAITQVHSECLWPRVLYTVLCFEQNALVRIH